MTERELLSPFRRAIEDYHMIVENDSIAVGLSGGKDSTALLTLMAAIKRFYPAKFELKAITIDMGFKDTKIEEVEAMKRYVDSLGVEYHIEKTDIAEIIFEARKEDNPCSLCAKMRRGALNTTATKMGCNKLALGHHADDLTETFFLSMFFEGRLSVFQPVTYMDRSKMTLIRPMIYIEEKDVVAFSRELPIIYNPCPANKHTERQYVKELLEKIKSDIPFAKKRIHSAIVHPERYNLFPTNDMDELIDN